MSKKIELTGKQRKSLNKLWWIYGNDGTKSTLWNHKLIQGFIEYNEDRRDDYMNVNLRLRKKYGRSGELLDGITDECLNDISKIID
jgi:hypothetical protein